MRAAIYARVSTDEQAQEGHSIDAQIRICREFAERKHWQVVSEYLDPGVSGTTTNRPGFQQLLADARAGKFDVVLVNKVDRFSRSLLDALVTLSALSRRGVSFCSAIEDFDFTTPMGKIVFAVIISFAEYFIDNLRSETKKGLKERALKGYNNGTLPFGYERVGKDPHAPLGAGQSGVPVLHPRNHKAYLHMVEMCLQQKNNREIAQWLNAHGYRTTGNRGANLFTPDAVADILHSRFYLGMVVYKDVWRQGKHSSAIDEETWEKVQASLRQRSTHRDGVKPSDRIYPLRRVLCCAECGARYHGQPRRGERFYLDPESAAKRCDGPQSLNALHVEAQVGELLEAVILPADWKARVLRRAGVRHDGDYVVAQRSRLSNELARARKLYIAGDLPDGEYDRIKQEVQLQWDKLQPVHVEDMTQVARLLESAGALWAAGKDSQRLELAQAMFERIWVRAGAVVAIEPRGAFYPLLAVSVEAESATKKATSGKVALIEGTGVTGVSPAPENTNRRTAQIIVILPPGSRFPGGEYESV